MSEGDGVPTEYLCEVVGEASAHELPECGVDASAPFVPGYVERGFPGGSCSLQHSIHQRRVLSCHGIADL